MFAVSKVIHMRQGNHTNSICRDADGDNTKSICGDANYDNVQAICGDANCDNGSFFDENDFEHFEWGTFLPHWQQDGKYVFVTFRLYDSLPKEKLQWLREEKESWLKRHPQPWNTEATKEYIERFGKAVDKWLDNGHGDCILKKQSNRKIVEEALFYYNGHRYDLVAFVVMPNHVHLLMKHKEGYSLTEIMRSIKSYTAKEINKNEKRSGPVWQSESYDRIIRDEKHFENVVRYIIANNKDLAWVAPSIVADCGTQSEK